MILPSIHNIYIIICKLGAQPLDGRGFFVINVMSLIIFDVLVPIGICVMLFLRSLTPYSQAVSRKQVFRLRKTSIFVFLPTLKLLRPHMFLGVFWSEQFQFFQEPLRIWTF